MADITPLDAQESKPEDHDWANRDDFGAVAALLNTVMSRPLSGVVWEYLDVRCPHGTPSKRWVALQNTLTLVVGADKTRLVVLRPHACISRVLADRIAAGLSSP